MWLDVSRDRVSDAAPCDSKAEDEKPKEPGYVAHVALDDSRIAVDGRGEAVAPVTAEIKTGRRNVISYLLSPPRRYAHEGARER